MTTTGNRLPSFFLIFSRRLHGKTSRTYADTDSNGSNHNEDQRSVKSLDAAAEPYETAEENPAAKLQSTGRDKRAYLKALELSLRTGRRIQIDGDDDTPSEHDSQSSGGNFLSRFINKYVRRRTANDQ